MHLKFASSSAFAASSIASQTKKDDAVNLSISELRAHLN
jgi:hypothetical protein